jgi:hypothetical protein
MFEQRLCDAIQRRIRIELRYKDDQHFRQFDPYAVYYSTKDNKCVSGTQVQNPNRPHFAPEPRIFDLSDIRDVRPTSTTFAPDPRFDRFDPRYKNGIICSI